MPTNDTQPCLGNDGAQVDPFSADMDAIAFACEHCSDTGVLEYETDTDDLDVLCHYCFEPTKPAPEQPARWSLIGYGTRDEGRIAMWAASEDESGLQFQFITQSGASGTLAYADHIYGVLIAACASASVLGEQCHEMCAARVIAAMNGASE